MEERIFRVSWDLKIEEQYPDEDAAFFDSPPGEYFRLTFPSTEQAATFIAEMQRFLGDLYLKQRRNG